MLAENEGGQARGLRTIAEWTSSMPAEMSLQKSFAMRTVYDDIARASDLAQVKNMLLDYIAYHENYAQVTNKMLGQQAGGQFINHQ